MEAEFPSRPASNPVPEEERLAFATTKISGEAGGVLSRSAASPVAEEKFLAPAALRLDEGAVEAEPPSRFASISMEAY